MRIRRILEEAGRKAHLRISAWQSPPEHRMIAHATVFHGKIQRSARASNKLPVEGLSLLGIGGAGRWLEALAALAVVVGLYGFIPYNFGFDENCK